MIEKIKNFALEKPFLSLAILTGVVLSPFIIISIARAGKTEVQISTAPTEIDLQIDGEDTRSGTKYLDPGEYTITGSREGFSDYESTHLIEDEPKEIFVALTPQTEEAFDIAREDSAFSDFEEFAGEEARREGEEFREKHPIVSELPYRSLIFDIDYRRSQEEESGIILEITADSETDREFARSQIRNWGYDIDDFEIEYR